MKKQTQDEKTTLTVGFVSPGWPLCDFPNGIVAYIQNITSGFDNRTQVVILARILKAFEASSHVINLSNFRAPKSTLQSWLDKILYRVKLPYLQAVSYKKTATYLAKNLNLAIQSLSVKLDILEMEESFGFAEFLKKINPTPIVIRLHGPHFLVGVYTNLHEDANFKLRVFCEGEAIKNAHGVTSPSLDVLNRVREYYDMPLPNAKVIANPVPTVNDDKQWKLELNKKPSILFVGRFESVKGGDLMLDAFRLIALQNKEVELVFVGPDKGVHLKDESIKFNEYMGRFIPEDSVKKRIQFLGHCDSQTIAALRMNSLITVFPSRYENFPVSLLEALATGCPTVATAVGGIKEIIVDNYNGLFAEPDSAQSIADKVLGLIDNPEKMQLLSKNAIKDCTERFSPKVIAAQTVAYYQSVLDKMSH